MNSYAIQDSSPMQNKRTYDNICPENSSLQETIHRTKEKLRLHVLTYSEAMLPNVAFRHPRLSPACPSGHNQNGGQYLHE